MTFCVGQIFPWITLESAGQNTVVSSHLGVDAADVQVCCVWHCRIIIKYYKQYVKLFFLGFHWVSKVKCLA